MKYLIMSLLLVLCCMTVAPAQQLGKFEPKVKKYGLGKLKKAKDKVYIARFNINFEVHKASQEFKQGSKMFGGGVRGDAEAKAAVALKGINEADLQAKTDQLYEEFIAELKAAGLQIIGADEAAQTKTYSKWERKSGGQINKSQYPGVLTVRPTGYDYFVKRVNKKGKEKTGFVKNYPALSKQLGDAIIADVDLTIMFSEDGKKYFKAGGFAKVKIKTNLRLIDNYTITAPKKGIFKGAVQTVPVRSNVAFYFGKVGMGSTTAYEGILKKPLNIENIIANEKIVASAVAKSDTWGTDYGVIRVYRAENVESVQYKLIDVDSEIYSQGAYTACKTMLDTHTKGFLEKLK
ncbi:MAG: hypothetical protein AAF985_01085 [Bacteroidota bacterium]